MSEAVDRTNELYLPRLTLPYLGEDREGLVDEPTKLGQVHDFSTVSSRLTFLISGQSPCRSCKKW